MDKIVDYIIKIIPNASLGIVLALVVMLISKISTIKSFTDELKYQRLKRISEALEKGAFEPEDEDFLKELKRQEYFAHSTGMRVNDKFRKAMIAMIKQSNGELSLNYYKRSLHYLDIKNGRIHVNLNILHYIIALLFTIILIVIFILTIIIFWIFIQSLLFGNDYDNQLKLFGIFLTSVVTTYMYARDVAGYYSAYKIKEFIVNRNNTT